MAEVRSRGTDRYANMLYAEVVESSANTLTFKEIVMGLTIFQKVAILIVRLEWFQLFGRMLAASDELNFGLSQSNSFTNVNPDEQAIITFHKQVITDYGTAGNNHLFEEPVVDDFTTLPGGGLLITPKPLYIFVKGLNLAATGDARLRMFFTVIPMKDAEYLELLEVRQFFS